MNDAKPDTQEVETKSSQTLVITKQAETVITRLLGRLFEAFVFGQGDHTRKGLRRPIKN